MLTDMEYQELVTRANMVVARGFGRSHAFPEQVAVSSPLVAEVLRRLIEDALRAKAANV